MQKARDLFSSMKIEFTFPTVKSILNADLTYPQFLGVIAQRIILKQYAAQVVDTKNVLCPIIRVSSIFDENKMKFSDSLKNIKLEKDYVSLINAQTSKNRITKEFQSSVAGEFIRWYEKNWFNRLRSEQFLKELTDSFENATLSEIKETDDWKKLYQMFSQVDTSKWLEDHNFDTRVFLNLEKDIDPKWFDTSLKSCMNYINLTGDVNLSEFERLIINEDLITPTVSSFMLSTLLGIEEIEEEKMKYAAPLDTYNLFSVFKGSVMGQLLKGNQFLFTLYKYFKIILR